jgi:hypothetical protein
MSLRLPLMLEKLKERFFPTEHTAICAICDTEAKEKDGAYTLEYDDSGAFFVCDHCSEELNDEGIRYEDYPQSDY